MPKRNKVTLADIADWQNLQLAAFNAAKGKRNTSAVLTFFEQYESNIEMIRQSILNGELLYGTYREFKITDPKPRLIHAAPFEDRIIHHAIINKMAARLEQSWVGSSYACRKGKGSHLAIIKAAELCRHSAYVVKLDVKSYFPQIQHDILLQTLSRQFKTTDLFILLDYLLRSFSSSVSVSGRGLPIGALTSQFFANHYLDGFQRWLRNYSGANAELRYMDDTLIFCDTNKQAKEVAAEASNWLSEYRHLTLKPAIIQRTSIGLTFCGFKISKQGVALGKRRKRQLKLHFNRLFEQLAQQQLHPLEAQKAALQVLSLRHPANNNDWLQQQLKHYQKDQLIEL